MTNIEIPEDSPAWVKALVQSFAELQTTYNSGKTEKDPVKPANKSETPPEQKEIDKAVKDFVKRNFGKGGGEMKTPNPDPKTDVKAPPGVHPGMAAYLQKRNQEVLDQQEKDSNRKGSKFIM